MKASKMTDDKIKIAIFLAAITIGLFFVIGMVSARYGAKVGDRFLERGAAYTEADLKNLASGEARGYAFPVLFPLDLLFMIFLGGFLGFASVGAAESIRSLSKLAWLFALGPALYVAADLIEDTLLARMLLFPEAVSQNAIDLAQKITRAKFVTSTFGILQTIVLSGLATLVDR
jgi:hypothetical protein